MEMGAALLLVVFGVMGFGVNLFFRIIFLYEDWQEGNQINWWDQFIYTVGVPMAFLFASTVIMAQLGFFARSTVFDFNDPNLR